ncbi:hypothetical protein [Pseudonocardia asaccharolytica]|uniref:DoxX family protein n=1 Tax=Pseudonocardia asaccharolytica DSM 44247 = NBRC 16224 TaxID=1123024 RepID=A0A511D3Y2_9PSEU|nr:hypothetical protein [Pseudonocardia asaccharolytica]GEL19511.1 hypothetical protein PA7_33480 [Pseudonocardia asaccharolytica DSM 44247 = NBRC 16224]
MAPLITLVGTWLVLRVIGLLGVAALDGWHPALRGGIAAMFLLTAAAHFSPKRRNDLIAMVPPGLPRRGTLVSVTGAGEAAGAIGLLLPATYRPAAACLALLLVLMFPANVHAARAGASIGGRAVTPLVPRAAMQLLFVACCIAVALF